MNFRRIEQFKLIQIKFHRELRWSTAQVDQVPVASSLAHLTGSAKMGLAAHQPRQESCPHGGCNGLSRPILVNPAVRWLGNHG
jgi:hypothetical protein